MTVRRGILVFCVALATSTAPLFAATVRVGPGERHSTLAAAIQAADSGDTVVVTPGVYNEHSLVVDAPISIVGRDGAVIDAGGDGEILTVRANGVRISGLTLCNVGTSFMEDRAAIRLSEVSNCAVEGNTLENAFFGVYAENTEKSVIRGNRIVGLATREATSGNGIHLWYCRGMKIEGNYVSGHRDGIYFEFVEDSSVRRNTSTRNLRYGLHFMFSNDDVYQENEFRDNGAGVAVMYSKRVTMAGNRFVHNWGRAAYGLLLKEITDSEIRENVFYRNTTAVYSEGSGRVRVERNDFVENGFAVKIMANSMDNVFTENNFTGNEFDVTTNSRQNFNTFVSNFWSEYRGYDLDRDGVGDVPHRPVRLYAILVDRQPPGIILMNSLFVHILDTAERVMPVFTPETLVDDHPLTEAVDIHGG
jgi:nitrous oxidase accessory protein